MADTSPFLTAIGYHGQRFPILLPRASITRTADGVLVSPVAIARDRAAHGGVRLQNLLAMVKAMEEIRKLMMEQRLAVLCTAQPDGQAYTSLVAFAASQDLKQIAFATMRATRKFANLSSNPRVARLLDDRAHA